MMKWLMHKPEVRPEDEDPDYYGLRGWWNRAKDAEMGDGWYEMDARDLRGRYGDPIYWHLQTGCTPSEWSFGIEFAHDHSYRESPTPDSPERRSLILGIGPFSVCIVRERATNLSRHQLRDSLRHERFREREAIIKIKVTDDNHPAA